jgi:hypothetical protein
MNPFEELADLQTPQAVKRKQQRQEARPEALITKDKEKSALTKAYKAQQQRRLEELLGGQWGTDLERLITLLAHIHLEAADELLDFVEVSPLRQADEELRYTALRLIDEAIISLRTRNGLPPVDDPLPGEPPNAFQIVKGVLFP